MTTNSWKPKEWVGITSGPNCWFAIACVLLLKGLIQLPCSLCLPLSTQPCLFLNTSTTSSSTTIPTLSNSIHYWFFNWCCPSLKPYPKSLFASVTQQFMWSLEHNTFISQLNNKGRGMYSINLKFVCQNCIHQRHQTKSWYPWMNHLEKGGFLHLLIGVKVRP
jgi:hypothetical protein